MDAASVFDVPDSRMECYRQYLDFLKRELRLFLGNANPPKDKDLPFPRKVWLSTQIEFLEQLLEGIPLAKRFYKDFGSIMNAEEQVIITVDTPSPRYLCILSACAIWCLDLKQSKSGPLVKLGELEVKNKGLPVSAGLFNWESDAYMICGCPDANPPPAETYSNDFYGLSFLVSDGTPLSLSRSNRFGTLNKPKRCPIVEQIDGQIHVIDSLHPYARPCHGQVFSHEVLYPGAKSWDQISPPITEKEWSCITSHLVVGNDIYAIAGYSSDRKHVRFCNATKEWEARPTTMSREGDPFSVKNVWNILDLGMARCIGKYPGATELYVLVAVAEKWYGPYGGDNGMVAVAYLVTGEGSVVCVQHLPHFFSLDPSDMVRGTMINVDAEGKMLCAIGEGYSLEGRQHFLYINTFSVEILTDKDRLVVGGGDCLPYEEELVRVAVREKYVYAKSGPRFEWDEPFQACFLF